MNTKKNNKNKSKNTKKKTIRNKKVHGGSEAQWNIIYNKLATVRLCRVTRFCEVLNGDARTNHYKKYDYKPDYKEINDYKSAIDGTELKETLELIDKLPNSYINENRNGTTLLHLICIKKPPVSTQWTIQIANKLIEKGADSNIPDKDNKIPLHYAVVINGADWCDHHKDESIYPEKFVNLINLLLENGSDPNFEDNKGITPFHRLYIDNDGLNGYELTRSAGNFKTVYKAATLLIQQGGDINKKIPENYTESWIPYSTNMYSNKSVFDIVKLVYNKRFSSHHPSFGLRKIVENMEKLNDETTPKRHELIERRERIKERFERVKELRQTKIDNYEQGAHSLQLLALETFLKEMKKTPTYKIIIDEDITSDVKKRFKNYLDTMQKIYNKEKVIDHKDENLKNIIEIIPEFIELLEKETENKIGELNKLSHSLRGFTDKSTEFYK
jgi:hypothetical protein